MTEKNILATKRKVPASNQQLKGFADGAAVNATKFTQRMAQLNSERELKRSEMEQNIQRSANPKEARKHFEAEFAIWNKAHMATSEKERWDMVRDLEEARLSVSESRSFLTNPVVIASNFELGEPRRSAIESTLNGRGGAALRTMMDRGIAANDLTAISAILSANDKLPRNERPFLSQEKAEAAFGEQATQARDMIRDVEAHAANALAANRMFEGAKINRISLALSHGDRLKLPQQPASISAKPLSPEQKVQKAFADMLAD